MAETYLLVSADCEMFESVFYGSVSVDKGYKSDVLVRVCLRQQSDIHQSENEGSNPSAPA